MKHAATPLRSNGTDRACLMWGPAQAGSVASPPGATRSPDGFPCDRRTGGLLDMVYTAAAMIARTHDGSETRNRSRAANGGAAIGRRPRRENATEM